MPFFLTKNRIIIISVAAAVVLFLVLLFSGLIPGLKIFQEKRTGATLTVWGAFDDKKALPEIIENYRAVNSGVEINYVNKGNDAEKYERELINALAAGTGPDIFMIHDTWLPKHSDKIVPLNEMDFPEFPFVRFRDSFPETVTEEFTRNNKIYASPLYIDTLAMFYNKDTFDKKGISLLPKTWDEFESDVKILREIDPKTNTIIKSAAAIGGSEKPGGQGINRATDLLSLLMLQSGAQMVDPNFQRATFASTIKDNENLGLKALNFYTKFGNPTSPVYTWQESFHQSIDSFSEGDAAVIFNYAHQIPVIKEKNPFLNFGIAPIPQFDPERPVTYPNYWGLAVSNKSKNASVAWNFILYSTINEKNAETYAKNNGLPPALRTLINKTQNDPTFGVFANQALNSKSWPQIDNNFVETSFSNMIEAVVTARLTPNTALIKSSDEITALMTKNR